MDKLSLIDQLAMSCPLKFDSVPDLSQEEIDALAKEIGYNGKVEAESTKVVEFWLEVAAYYRYRYAEMTFKYRNQ